MKKRLLSMLMAVLMIASLVPATALAAGTSTCKHDYKEVSINVDVTAKTPGVVAKVCTLCGDVQNVKVTPFTAKKCTVCTNLQELVVSKASCSQPGLTITYCGDCGNMSKKIAPEGTKALTHEYKFFVAVKPTCTDNGWGYAVCQLCNEPVYVDGPSSSVITTYVAKADQQAIKDMYAKTGHVKDEALVAVTENVYNKDNPKVIDRYAGVAAKHVATVGLVPVGVDKDGNFNAYADAPDATGVVATMVCPDCDAVIVPKTGDNASLKGGTKITALNVSHAAYMEVTKKGQLPAVVKDAKGNVVATEDGWTDEVYCAKCKTTIESVAIPYAAYTKATYAFGTSVVAGVDVKAGTIQGAKDYKDATCTQDGYTGDTYVWTEVKGLDDKWGNLPGAWVFNHKGTAIPAKGHDYQAKANVAATCQKSGIEFVGVYECSVCGNMVDAKGVDITREVNAAVKDGTVGSTKVGSGVVQITPAGTHAWTTMELAAPTCYSTGLSVIGCKDCGKVKDVVVLKTVGHVAADELANVVEATCTEAGYSGDQVCKWCGEILKKGEEVPALGHKTEVKDAKAATCTEAGYTGDEVCTVCGETVKKGTEIPALGHKFENGVCTVCGEKDPNYVAPVVNPFKDVEKTSPYYDAIIWAAKEEITTGKTADTFGIDEGCTRAQIVTFLYRAAGSPEVKADTVNPFTDVSKDSVYYNAILWAVENGITKGTTETTFDPNAVCTRGQIVTFLFRASGDEKVATGTNFADVASGSYCADAVAWAVANKVANGFADGTFRPEATCTRGQAVTFIFRALAE